jgi:hypothetical protein
MSGKNLVHHGAQEKGSVKQNKDFPDPDRNILPVF